MAHIKTIEQLIEQHERIQSRFNTKNQISRSIKVSEIFEDILARMLDVVGVDASELFSDDSDWLYNEPFLTSEYQRLP